MIEPREYPSRIVAFTKDWDDVPTCTTHILREMGKTMPVLWVNSIGTRKPDLKHPAHFGRIFRRLCAGLRLAELKENHLRVLSPLLIPMARGRLSQFINRRLFAWQANRELRRMGNGPIEYWCFVPNAVDLLPCDTRHATRNTHHAVVYYCVDDWTKFHYLDTTWMARKERELLARADVVFAVSQYLVDELGNRSDSLESNLESRISNLQYMPHGVEYGKFRAALELGCRLPGDVARLPKPMIGFYGNIYPWVDLDLLEKLADERPEWSFVMIGGVFCDVSRFDNVLNVHFLGRREHDELPGYCAAFDAAIIPYDMGNPRMASVNPVKARELLAAGVPVVASDVPELRQFGKNVIISATVNEWLEALDKQAIRKDRETISDSVANDDWATRVGHIREVVAAAEYPADEWTRGMVGS